VTAKRKQLDLKAREIKWIIGSHSPLSLENKILIYKTILKPVWTYGIELWGCASNSNIEIIQRYQSKLLRLITNAQWYVTNRTLHSDLHHPLRPRGLPGKDSKSPQLNSFAPQPPHGTTATTPDHQASKTTMDFR
jgi:hypothetical protein